MDKAEKQSEIQYLSGRFEKAQLALCVDYRGLTVSQVTTLRRNLRQSGAEARVVKNKLARISVERGMAGKDQAHVERLIALFKEPSFMVFADADPVAPVKIISDFAKQNEKLRVKGAWVDGTYVDVKGIETLSKLPGKNELLAQLLSLINAPATRLVSLMQAPAGQVVRLIEAQRKNIEAK